MPTDPYVGLVPVLGDQVRSLYGGSGCVMGFRTDADGPVYCEIHTNTGRVWWASINHLIVTDPSRHQHYELVDTYPLATRRRW